MRYASFHTWAYKPVIIASNIKLERCGGALRSRQTSPFFHPPSIGHRCFTCHLSGRQEILTSNLPLLTLPLLHVSCLRFPISCSTSGRDHFTDSATTRSWLSANDNSILLEDSLRRHSHSHSPDVQYASNGTTQILHLKMACPSVINFVQKVARTDISRSICDEDGVRSWLGSSQLHLHDGRGRIDGSLTQIKSLYLYNCDFDGIQPKFSQWLALFPVLCVNRIAVTICKTKKKRCSSWQASASTILRSRNSHWTQKAGLRPGVLGYSIPGLLW